MAVGFRCKVLAVLALLVMLPIAVKGQTLNVRNRFNPGEEVKYDLYFKWGVIMPHAGTATLTINNTTYRGNAAFLYRLNFYTSGIIEKVYKMRDTIDDYFTPSMLLLFSEKRSNENDYVLTDDLTFSYSGDRTTARSHRYTPEKTKIDTLLVSNNKLMLDMLGCTLYLRSIDWDNLQMNQAFPFCVAIGRDIVNIRFRYVGQQVVQRSATLKYRAHHFYVDIFDDAFTQSKAAAELWVGDDENHIPVRIRSKLKVGAAEVHFNSAKGLRYPLSSRIVLKSSN